MHGTMARRRRLSVTGTGALLGAILAATTSGAASPAPPPAKRTCSQLTTNAKVHGDVKVAKQGGKVYGCVLPDGPVVEAGTELPGARTELQTVTFLQSSGPFATFDVLHVDNIDGGGSDETGTVVDLRTGRQRSLPAYCSDTPMVLGADGRVALLSTCKSDATRLVGLTPRGATIYLDLAHDAAGIPAASITLDGRTVRWTHGGAARTGRL